MKVKFLLTIVVTSVIFFSNAPAQTVESDTAKVISGGIVNGKAVVLDKPAFPKAARDAGADGAVLIQVTIDEKGNVIAAEAVSGHPLLREVSIQAARASKFSPTTVAGQPVKVTGVIVYNFVLPMPYMQIGFELALAQKNPTPVEFPLAAMSGTLPRYWTDECGDLKKLESFRLEKPADNKKPEEEEDPKPAQKEKPEQSLGRFEPIPPGSVNQGTTLKAPPLQASKIPVGGSNFVLNNKIPEAVETLKSVQERLDTRLRPNPKVLWYFRAGRILGSIKAEIDDAGKRRENLAALVQLLENLPAGISESALNQIQKVAEFSQKSGFDAKSKDKLLTELEKLRKLRVE